MVKLIKKETFISTFNVYYQFLSPFQTILEQMANRIKFKSIVHRSEIYKICAEKSPTLAATSSWSNEIRSNLCRYKMTKNRANHFHQVSWQMIYRNRFHQCQTQISKMQRKWTANVICKLKLRSHEMRRENKKKVAAQKLRRHEKEGKNNVRKEKYGTVWFGMVLTCLAFFNFDAKLLSWAISFLCFTFGSRCCNVCLFSNNSLTSTYIKSICDFVHIIHRGWHSALTSTYI